MSIATVSSYSQTSFATKSKLTLGAVNPAFTPESCKMAVSLLYRNNYWGLEGAPRYATSNFLYSLPDTSIYVGAMLSSFRIGALNSTSLQTSYSHKFAFNLKSSITFGLRMGLRNYGYEKGMLVSDKGVVDPEIENLDKNNSFIASVGIFYKNRNFYGGFAMQNLIDRELNNSDFDFPDNLKQIGYSTVGYLQKLENFKTIFMPNISSEFQSFKNSVHTFNFDFIVDNKIQTGIGYKTNKTFALSLGVAYKDFLVKYTYESHVGNGIYSISNTNHEILLSFLIRKQKRILPLDFL